MDSYLFNRAPRRSPYWTRKFGAWTAAVAGAALFVLLVVPLTAIFLRVTPLDIWRGMQSPVAVQALQISLTSTSISLALLVLGGTPLAYWLGTREFRAKRWVETLIDLPIAIPPAVIGVGLLMAFGRNGIIGRYLAAWDVTLAFSLAAVVLAEVVVAAPHYVRGAQQAFAAVNPRLPLMARSLGASPGVAFWRITLPLAMRGLTTAAAVAWARALGEFGATIMFAGNLAGKTQTLPLAVYTAMESDLQVALAMSALLAAAGFFILVATKTLAERGQAHDR